MKLDQHEAQSALWRKLEKHLTQRLADKRRANDNDQDPIRTANLRGRIAELKELLALAQSPPPEAATDDDGE